MRLGSRLITSAEEISSSQMALEETGFKREVILANCEIEAADGHVAQGDQLFD